MNMTNTVTPAEMDALPMDSVVVYETIFDDGSMGVGAAKRDGLGNWWTTDGEHYPADVIAKPTLDCCDAHIVVRLVYQPASVAA